MDTETFYADLDLTFNLHPVKKDLVLSKNEKAVIRSIKNLVLTGFYERLFQSEIGSNVSKMLFEPNSPITKNVLEQEIFTVIRLFEPRATNITVTVDNYEDQQYLVATISFYLTNSTQLTTVDVLLERAR